MKTCTDDILYDLILSRKINIYDIAFETRIRNSSIYVLALRSYRHYTEKNKKKYIEILNLLNNDINNLPKELTDINLQLSKIWEIYNNAICDETPTNINIPIDSFTCII